MPNEQFHQKLLLFILNIVIQTSSGKCSIQTILSHFMFYYSFSKEYILLCFQSKKIISVICYLQYIRRCHILHTRKMLSIKCKHYMQHTHYTQHHERTQFCFTYKLLVRGVSRSNFWLQIVIGYCVDHAIVCMMIKCVVTHKWYVNKLENYNRSI